ncbi:MAG: YkuS family protein [Firmicutes bacterium]|nr:YkuS family protein [Bacillota bacterium]
MLRVAVEDDLAGIRERLRQEGFQVVGMDQVGVAEVVVTSGLDRNVMGHHDIVTRGRVVEARGKTVDEVVREVAGFGRS